MCKYGVDPLYDDDEMMSIRVPTARIVMTFDNSSATTEPEDAATLDYNPDRASTAKIEGTYAIKFYDVFGEDYETAPILVSAGCDDIVSSLESLPNTVVPANSVRCTDLGDYPDTASPDAASYVFNVATVLVDSGGSLVVDGAGALTVTGRGEDTGWLAVGDEDDDEAAADPFRAAAERAPSELVAGRLALDRFGGVRVRRGGAVRATSDVAQGAEDDAWQPD